MKTILTFLAALLLFCGFSTNNLYANPSDNTTVSSIPGTFDGYYSIQSEKNYPMQYDGRAINVRVIWEMDNGKIVSALGGAAGEALFSAKEICSFDADVVYLTTYLNDTKNTKKIEITGYVNTTTGYIEFKLIDHGSGRWPWPFE